MLKLIGPFTPYIADEAWAFGQTGKEYGEDFLCLQEWPVSTELGSRCSIVKDVQTLLDLKDSRVNEALESLRVKKEIGQSLDAEVELQLSKESKISEILNRMSTDELAELFIVSSVVVSNLADYESDRVVARHAPGVRCPRSWRWVPQLVKVEPWGEVSRVVLKCLPTLIEILSSRKSISYDCEKECPCHIPWKSTKPAAKKPAVKKR